MVYKGRYQGFGETKKKQKPIFCSTTYLTDVNYDWRLRLPHPTPHSPEPVVGSLEMKLSTLYINYCFSIKSGQCNIIADTDSQCTPIQPTSDCHFSPINEVAS